MHAVVAPLYYELLVTHVPVTEQDADRGAAAALAAARAGVFTEAGEAKRAPVPSEGP